MKLDILAIIAHPDDAELCFSGTLIKHQKMGYSIGIIDLTQGELGSRGTPEIRAKEANEAAKIMKLSIRENLRMEDGFFENNKENKLKVVAQIRKYKPTIIITNALFDRHPDHSRAAVLVETACFIAGLNAVKTSINDESQLPHRPKRLFFSIQSTLQEPDLLIDISEVISERKAAILAFKSQFYDPKSKEKETFISSKNFLPMLESRTIEWGTRIGVEHAEGFKVKQTLSTNSLFNTLV